MKIKSISIVMSGVVLLLSWKSLGLNSDTAPCAVIIKATHGSQVIPVAGKVNTRLKEKHEVGCGSMIVTHKDPLWIRYSDQVVYRVAPDTFIEVSQSKNAPTKVFRGSVLIDTDAAQVHHSVVTPNAQVSYEGGMILVSYLPKEKKSALSVFRGQSQMTNRFFDGATQKVAAGEMTDLSIGAERTLPTQPELISPTSVVGAVASFDLPEAETKGLKDGVEKTFERRARSFVAEIENWQEIQSHEDRSPASQGESALEEEEARQMLNLLQERLYGSKEDFKMLDKEPGEKSGSRSVASEAQPLRDPMYRSIQKKKNRETLRLMDEVSRINPRKAPQHEDNHE